MAIFAFYGVHGGPLEWEGIPIYPGGTEPWGNDVVTAYALHHMRGDRNSGWLMLLQDVWVMKSEALKNLHVAAWAPVDHTPAPPAVVDFFKTTGAVPISMSKHGQQMFQDAGLNPIYVPHGIDTKQFAPRDDRDALREAMGIPTDAFVFGMVAANKGTTPPRKSFPQVFQAFAKFHAKHPDSILYLHTMKNKMHGGCVIPRLLEACGVPEKAVVYVDQFSYTLGDITMADMPMVYATMDVLVNPAYGEGFGMPIIEAQSCGVPVILADNTAMPELCGSGWLVPSEPYWDEEQGSWWGLPRWQDIYATMEKAYHVTDRMRREAREFVVKDYDADDITEKYWKPCLAELEEMLQVPKADPVDMSAVLETV